MDLWVLLVVAALNALTAYWTWQSKHCIKVLEFNTNSIKDALIASTAKASHSEGYAAGKAEAWAEAKAGLASS